MNKKQFRQLALLKGRTALTLCGVVGVLEGGRFRRMDDPDTVDWLNTLAVAEQVPDSADLRALPEDQRDEVLLKMMAQ
jgi:hypothetical protein